MGHLSPEELSRRAIAFVPVNKGAYYKTAYPEHNFDSSKNQFKLIQSLSEQFAKM